MGNESKRRSLTNDRRRGDRSNRDHSMGYLRFRHVHGWVNTWWLHAGLYP